MLKPSAAMSALLIVVSCGVISISGNPNRIPAQPAVPVAAPPPPLPPEVRLVAAIENQGCVLTGDNVGRVLLTANMTQEELTRTMNRLEELGRVEAVGSGGIRVLTDRCA